MMWHFTAMCFSMAPSFPRRGPGFQFKMLSLSVQSSGWEHRRRSGIPLWMENASSLVPRETQDLRPSRRHCGDAGWSRDRTSPKPKISLVWTRRLPRSQKRSPRQDTAKIIAWEGCQTVLDESNCEHGFSKALVRPRVPKILHILEFVYASSALLAHWHHQDDCGREGQPRGAGSSRVALHPSS